jgi:hypothetical protein
MPKATTGTKTAVYIATKWRDDFVKFDEEDNQDRFEALVQLWLLELILFIDDLHPANCGIWKLDGSAAIVDLFMKTGYENDASGYELKDPVKSFCVEHYPKINFDPKSKEIVDSKSQEEKLEIARKLLNAWNMLSQIDNADDEIKNVKQRIKDLGTKFGHPDDSTYKATNSLESYIVAIKSNINRLLQ